MNLDDAKRNISKYLNKNCKFVYKGIRNQTEEFEGKIIKMFPSVFTIELSDGSIKTFSYADYVIKSIKIVF